MKFAAANVVPRAEDVVQQDSTTLTSQTGIASPLASSAVRAAIATFGHFPTGEPGHSLAEMAQRDLDAALQLLADRAQYITGAGGAAIALRRSGRNDMLCRASTGSNAPELGALLSTEFGLSGESVRTRRPLRCDNAERDARVNREVCRRMGITSVAVMPVVHDDEVLGVFELFSGKLNAFGERDLSALRRLSEMVETAVKLARAAEELPEQLKSAAASGEMLATEVRDIAGPITDLAAEPDVEVETEAAAELPAVQPVLMQTETARAEAPPESGAAQAAQAQIQAAPPEAASAPAKPVAPKRPLYWSAPLNAGGEAQKTEPDQTHIPPVLRNLRQCEACGFPITAGRRLCVECEEKRWRGQRTPARAGKPASAPPAVSASTARAFAATAVASAAPAAAPQRASAAVLPAPGSAHSQTEDSRAASSTVTAISKPQPVASTRVAEAAEKVEAPTPAAPIEITFSAGLEPSQSWFAANKYILGALLVVGATVAAILLLR